MAHPQTGDSQQLANSVVLVSTVELDKSFREGAEVKCWPRGCSIT